MFIYSVERNERIYQGEVRHSICKNFLCCLIGFKYTRDYGEFLGIVCEFDGVLAFCHDRWFSMGLFSFAMEELLRYRHSICTRKDHVILGNER